ncbi:hypothetical protein FOS14_07915 [Skermania sp. ID1734]|nr:hypothetical protein [Skermania sp. ID1734]TSE00345.1 hypothetical protein FOS14_07915 [Skermania sp. ID1734]
MPVTVIKVAPMCPSANVAIQRSVPSQRSAATMMTRNSMITGIGLLPWSIQNADATSTCNGSLRMLCRLVDASTITR